MKDIYTLKYTLRIHAPIQIYMFTHILKGLLFAPVCQHSTTHGIHVQRYIVDNTHDAMQRNLTWNHEVGKLTSSHKDTHTPVYNIIISYWCSIVSVVPLIIKRTCHLYIRTLKIWKKLHPNWGKISVEYLSCHLNWSWVRSICITNIINAISHVRIHVYLKQSCLHWHTCM